MTSQPPNRPTWPTLRNTSPPGRAVRPPRPPRQTTCRVRLLDAALRVLPRLRTRRPVRERETRTLPSRRLIPVRPSPAPTPRAPPIPGEPRPRSPRQLAVPVAVVPRTDASLSRRQNRISPTLTLPWPRPRSRPSPARRLSREQTQSSAPPATSSTTWLPRSVVGRQTDRLAGPLVAELPARPPRRAVLIPPVVLNVFARPIAGRTPMTLRIMRILLPRNIRALER